MYWTAIFGNDSRYVNGMISLLIQHWVKTIRKMNIYRKRSKISLLLAILHSQYGAPSYVRTCDGGR